VRAKNYCGHLPTHFGGVSVRNDPEVGSACRYGTVTVKAAVTDGALPALSVTVP